METSIRPNLLLYYMQFKMQSIVKSQAACWATASVLTPWTFLIGPAYQVVPQNLCI